MYEVAPEEAFHDRVGAMEMFFALFVGELRLGAAGGFGIVVKLLTLENELVPAGFVAETRQ